MREVTATGCQQCPGRNIRKVNELELTEGHRPEKGRTEKVSNLGNYNLGMAQSQTLSRIWALEMVT